jgi:uncharacterized protein YndB with AHSA1/START domain
MENGSIQRQLYVEASPEVVFEVVSSPEHISQWWSDSADLEPVPGASGEIVFGKKGAPGSHVAHVTVVEVDAPRLFSFRWVYPDGETPSAGNSLLVTFALVPTAGGTTIHLTEDGFREKGWEAAELEAAYADHVGGWDSCVTSLTKYLTQLVATS